MKKLFPIGSPQYINRLNKIKLLNLIREEGQISRADLAKKSGISAPTVTRIVENLISEEGLVHEIGTGVSSGGRRPTLIEFSSQDNFVIGIDLGTTHIDGVLSNLNAEEIVEISYETRLEEGIDKIMDRTGKLICELQNHKKVKGKRIFGVGLAVAGLINKRKNIIEFSPDFHWENIDIINRLQKSCDIPMIIDNVTRVMAIGELFYGIGHHMKNFVVVNVGYGIGAGLIINGEPFYGPVGISAEFGHLTMDKNSKLKCECGNYGCLEALASGRAIALRAKNELAMGNRSSLSEHYKKDPENITGKLVVEAAKNGDKFAQHIFDDALEYLGVGIANLINFLHPQAVLIGGGVSQAGDILFDRVNEIVHQRTLKSISGSVKILPVTFGMKAATKGAVSLILNKVLKLKSVNTPINQ